MRYSSVHGRPSETRPVIMLSRGRRRRLPSARRTDQPRPVSQPTRRRAGRRTGRRRGGRGSRVPPPAAARTSGAAGSSSVAIVIPARAMRQGEPSSRHPASASRKADRPADLLHAHRAPPARLGSSGGPCRRPCHVPRSSRGRRAPPPPARRRAPRARRWRHRGRRSSPRPGVPARAPSLHRRRRKAGLPRRPPRSARRRAPRAMLPRPRRPGTAPACSPPRPGLPRAGRRP